MKTSSLFDQCRPVVIEAAAMICGLTQASPQFRTTLRELDPLPEGFTVGDLARAYLTATLARLDAIGKQNTDDAAAASARRNPQNNEKE